MDRAMFAKIETYMRTCMKDASHDREHVIRVLHNVVRIGQRETGVHWDVLIIAALLHDISRPEQLADASVDHASHGAEKARTFLLAEGFSADVADQVASCIRTHRFRKSAPPQSLEARILFDADKLDVAGAVGIARTLAYNGETGRPLYTRDSQGSISDGTGDAEDSFFREYKFKLENICDHFLTDAGRELAMARHAAAKAYYAALLAEVRDDAGEKALDAILGDL